MRWLSQIGSSRRGAPGGGFWKIFFAWFAADERVADKNVGYCRETIVIPYERHETIYSGQNYKIGLARTPR